MLITYFLSKPVNWIIPWIIQAFIYYRLLRKIGQDGKYALIPFVAEGRFSRIYFKNRSYYFHSLIETAIFLMGGFYLRYYGRGMMSALFGIIFIIFALIIYGIFLIILYWKIAKSFHKKFFYCLFTSLIPFVFLFLLTRKKETFYEGPSYKISRLVSKPMRVAYYVLCEVIFIGEALALLFAVGTMSIISYMPGPLVKLLIQDKHETIADIRGNGLIIDRENSMGDEYAKLASNYETSRDKYFPDHSKDESVVVIEYIIGSNLEDNSGLASFNILQMLDATKGSSALKFVIEAGGSRRWFTDGIKNSSLGRYEIADGKLTEVKSLDNTVSMSDPDHLYEFLKWAKDNYKADRYMLIFWDHGGGLGSGYGQDDINKREDNINGTILPNEIEEVLKKLDMKFDLIGFDACLMQNVEVAKIMEPYADYFLASEETETGDGWFYTSAFKLLANNPGIATEDFSKEMISSFDVYNTALNKKEKKTDTTLSLIDLTRINPAFELLSELYEKQDAAIRNAQADYVDIASAAKLAYSFTNDEQIDLINYLQLLDDSDYDDSIASSENITNIINYLKAAIVYRNTVSNEGVNGIAVTFPYKDVSSYGQEHVQYKALSMDRAMNFYDDYFSIIAYQHKDDKFELFGIEIPVNTDFTQEEWYVEGFEEYVDVPAIIDIPLSEKDGIYEPQIPDNVWKIITDSKEVFYQKCDEGWRYLGKDVPGMIDVNDRPLLSTDGFWVYINNHLICYEASDAVTSEDGVVYKGTTKALLNDSVEIILDIRWKPVNDETGQYVTGEVAGYRLAGNDSFHLEKGDHELKPGERIRFLFDYYDEDGKLIKTEPYGGTIIVTSMSNLRVRDRHLDECDLKYGIVLSDAYQRTFATEMIESHITKY